MSCVNDFYYVNRTKKMKANTKAILNKDYDA